MIRDGRELGAAAEPEPDHDARLRRMDRVAVLYAEITAASREFLRALAESDRHRDWAELDFGSCAEWLAWRIGVTRNTANERVRVARALEELPLISGAMARGELSFSKVRALTRAATPENEADLLGFARAASAARLERLVRGWKRLGRDDEAAAERIRHRSRTFSVFPDEDGMYVVRGLLTPEVGAALMRAVEAAGDALYRERGGSGGSKGEGGGSGGDTPGTPDPQDPPDPAQLRADAVGLVAERALAAGFGGSVGGGGGGKDDDPVPVSGSRAERYQVMLHVEEEALAERTTLAPGGEDARSTLSELEDGTRVSAETARRLSCDAGLVRVRVDGGDGGRDSRNGRTLGSTRVLGVGRRTRTVPAALRRALEVRDRGCRFPGCGLRFTDAHHIEHWADGGRTELANLVLLCRRHHRRVHEEGWRVCSDVNRQVVFFTPKGKALFDVPEVPEESGPPKPSTAPELPKAPEHPKPPIPSVHPKPPEPSVHPRPPEPPKALEHPKPPEPSKPLKHPKPPASEPPPSGPSLADRLLRRNRARAVAPDWRTGRPEYRRDRDIPWEVEARALEALDA